MPDIDFSYQYGSYGIKWTDERLEQVKKAMEQTKEEDRHVGEPGSPFIARRDGGYISRETGEFVHTAVISTLMDIATEVADELLDTMPVMPEDESVVLRYPGIDPIGKSCSTEMYFEQRMASIKAVLETRPPEVTAYVKDLLKLDEGSGIVNTWIRQNMKSQFGMARTTARAAKLCPSAIGRRYLREQSRRYEMEGMAQEYNRYLQGIEHALGIDPRPELPREVLDLYREKLGVELNMEMHRKGRETVVMPPALPMEFQNFTHKLFHKAALDPDNWGLSSEQIVAGLRKGGAEQRRLGLTDQDIDNTVTTYARATVDRVLQPILGHTEKTADKELELSRGDYIIVDGQTVREKMIEEYAAERNGSMEDFDEFFAANVRQKTNEYVAAALMTGKRIEAFVPDRFGNIPREPMQIVKSGYGPAPVEKVTLNAWERFFAKRGFYKEKAAKAAEYERFEAARERLRQRSFLKCTKAAFNTKSSREAFFGDWSRETGRERPHYEYDNSVQARDVDYTLDRTADLSVAVCYMASKGYSLKDIFDPTRETALKQRLGAETMARFEAHDHDWITATIYEGQKALLRQIDGYVQNKPLHIEDERELFSPENRELFAAGEVLFDTVQEVKRSNAERYERLAMNDLPAGERAGASAETIEAKGRAAAAELLGRANTSALYLQYAAESLEARFDMMEGRTPPVRAGEKVAKIGRFEGLRRACGDAVWGEKSKAPKLVVVEDARARIKLTPKKGAGDGSGFSRFFTVGQTKELAQGLLSDIADPRRNTVAEEYAADAQQIRKFGRDLVEGKMRDRFVMEIHENGDGKRALTIAPEKEKKAARNVHEPREQKQGRAPAAPNAGGRTR